MTEAPTNHHKFVDISGQRFGLLVAKEIAGRSKYGYLWQCICDCGQETSALRTKLQSGHTRSCGCLIDKGRRDRAKHRMIKSAEYRVWCGMKARCMTPTNKRYEYYGARGVSVAPEWAADFNAFLSHIGPRPSPKHSLDRIDVDGNYEPGNVRWALPEVQMNNKRTVPRYTHGGKTMTISEWARETGLSHKLISGRLARGWDIGDAVSKPPSRNGWINGNRRR